MLCMNAIIVVAVITVIITSNNVVDCVYSILTLCLESAFFVAVCV